MSVPWPRSTLLRQSNSRWPLRRRGAGRGTAMLATVLLVAGLSSCDGGNEAGTTTARPPLPSSETSSTITAEPATTSRQANGAPGPGCINGRITPAPAEPLRTQPLDIIRSQMGVTGRFEVVEMRYFTGPEVPWILAPRPRSSTGGTSRPSSSMIRASAPAGWWRSARRMSRDAPSINARDVAGLAALMTDDHRFVNTAGGAVEGRSACLDAWRTFFDAFPDYRNEFDEVASQGHRVVARGRSHCSTPELDGPALWHAHVAQGLIREWRVHDDTPANRRALGLEET